MGTCGVGNGGEAVYHALSNAIERNGLDIRLVATGCFGARSQEVMVNVWIPGKPMVLLRQVQASDAESCRTDPAIQVTVRSQSSSGPFKIAVQ
jgi:hypothetical protein